MSSESNISSKPLGDHGTLFTETIKGSVSIFKYYAACKGFHTLNLTLNFDKSVNFELCVEDGNNGSIQLLKPLEASITIGPDETSSKLTIKQIDAKKGGSLSMALSCVIEKPGKEYVAKLAVAEKKRLKKLVSEAIEAFPPQVVRSASISDIENRCKTHAKSFIDVSFPPTDTSLFATLDHPDGAPTESTSASIVWRRPCEFMSQNTSNLKLFDGGIEPADIKQGLLGNCWMMCALSSLAEYPTLVEKLFVQKEYNPNGIYQVNLWKNGEWSTVTIDDYFPCYPGEGPIYSHAHGNELWVLLIEKAFAKLHGSYAMLRSGFTYEAFLDLTGAPYRDIRFFDVDVKSQIRDGSLWQYLCHCAKEGYIMALSTPAHNIDATEETSGTPAVAVDRNTLPSGLVPAHGYTILTVVNTRGGHKLVKIRNPWADSEWIGAWSDKSNLWTPELKAELQLTAEDDGVFWMAFDDVVKHFVSLNICKCRHDRVRWFEFRHAMHFKFSNQGRGVLFCDMNKLQIAHNNVNVYFSIHQPDKRCLDSKPYIDIGITILKATSDPQKFELVASSGNTVERQNQIEVKALQAGEYYVVPTSCGTKLQQFSDEATAKGASFRTEDYLRRAVVVFHSAKEFSIEGTAFNEYAFKEALVLPTIFSPDHKTSDLFGDGSVLLYTLRSGYCGISYVVR